MPDAVDLGGVEERHAELDGSLEGGERLRIVAGAVGLAHAHASQPERRNLEALFSQLALLQHHFFSLVANRSFARAMADMALGQTA